MKKVLIITYYWPPAGGPGVQRWLKFVKYLPGFGIEPIVYVPENPTYPIVDEGLNSEVSEEIIVLKKKIIEPYGLASIFSKKKVAKISAGIIPDQRKQSLIEKISLWVRGNFFIPDARVLWVKPSVKFLKKYIVDHDIQTIITSGPPHSLHLIGLELQKQTKADWIADFRDPWTTIGYHKELKLSDYAAKRHKDLERKVLNAADLILVTSNTTKTEFSVLTKKPIEVITNGFDTETVERQAIDSKFTLAHIGSLLSERNPDILWRALSEIVSEIPSFAADFELKLIGTVSDNVLIALENHGLTRFVSNLGYVSHSEAIAHQRKSQVLLLLEIDSPDTRGIIPGKLFEYMASGRPIIGIGPQGAEFANLINETNTGFFVDYLDYSRLKSGILDYYSQYKSGELKANGVGIQQFSRKNLTQKLAAILERTEWRKLQKL